MAAECYRYGVQMDEEKLADKLRSIGKAAFVNHYYLFKDFASNKIGRKSAVKSLVDQGVSNEAGAWWRLGSAKTIFDEKANCAALMMIRESHRLTDDIIQAAKKILKADCQ